MAIFERKFDPPYTKIDETHKIECIIETAQEVNGHTEYLLRCQRGIIKKDCWRTLRRYNEFAELYKSLSISGCVLHFPGKRFFGNMHPNFIAERRQSLQVFINTVLMNPILASSLPAKRFVDPDSYSQSFHDQAVSNALLCLRNETSWTLGPSLGAIGWRLRKHYFQALSKPPEYKSGNKLLVKSSSQSHTQSKQNLNSCSGSDHGGRISLGKEHQQQSFSSKHDIKNEELIIEWLEYGPDKYIEDKELSGILKSLMNLKHPHIESIIYAGHNESGCLVIRKFHKHGTLKDILCMATPKLPFLSKYGNPKGRTALSIKQVAIYGKQILEALIFLHSKGFPYGHLHSGNIVILNDSIKILDIENFILGVPSFYRPFFVQHSKIHKPEAIDVYCFGHVLFEMAMGYPLQESIVRHITECPESLKNLLESILSKDACRSGLPSLEQLLKHNFFIEQGVIPETTNEDTSYFKLSLNSKESIKNVAQKTENRLREEQKSVKNQKRIVRVQELMSSEEEKRKTKQKAKHDHKQLKLKQQSSLQNTNGKFSLPQTVCSNSTNERAEGVTNTLIRMNSLHIANIPQDANYSLKSPPATPLVFRKCNKSEVLQNSPPLRQTTLLASVDRQSSSPNITTDTESYNEIERSALLESICKFNRGSLRKVRSND